MTLNDLLAGPMDAKRTDGLGTALPGTVLIDGVRIEAGVALLTLGASVEGTRNDEILAYGQMVCTLDAGPISTPCFRHAGERSTVPTSDGPMADRRRTDRMALGVMPGQPSPG